LEKRNLLANHTTAESYLFLLIKVVTSFAGCKFSLHYNKTSQSRKKNKHFSAEKSCNDGEKSDDADNKKRDLTI